MDMMYMPDALNAIFKLLEADPAKLKHRNAFNITAMSFAPETIAAEIKKHIPKFKMSYDVDPVRQAIADSWPNSLDDSCAKKEWGWKPKYTLESMTKDMLEKLSEKLGIELPNAKPAAVKVSTAKAPAAKKPAKSAKPTKTTKPAKPAEKVSKAAAKKPAAKPSKGAAKKK